MSQFDLKQVKQLEEGERIERLADDHHHQLVEEFQRCTAQHVADVLADHEQVRRITEQKHDSLMGELQSEADRQLTIALEEQVCFASIHASSISILCCLSAIILRLRFVYHYHHHYYLLCRILTSYHHNIIQ